MSIKGAVILPHSTDIIKNINNSEFSELLQSYKKAIDLISNKKVQTLVILSPHTTLYLDYFHISLGKTATAAINLGNSSSDKLSINYDMEFTARLSSKTQENKISFGVFGDENKNLDKGCYVPLWLLKKYNPTLYDSVQLVRIGVSELSQSEHYRLGKLIKETAEELGKDTVVIASGELSCGNNSDISERKYDRQIMKIISKSKFDKLFEFPEDMYSEVGACVHRGLTALAGCFDGYEVETQKLYYGVINGKSYTVCTFEEKNRDNQRKFLLQYEEKIEKQIKKIKPSEDEYINIAREAVKEYTLYKNVISVPDGISEVLKHDRCGVFVFLHEDGMLRGCFGTTYSSTACIAQEIIRSAIYACGHDPRFKPVRPEELKCLEISVYTVRDVETVSDKSELDADRYGIIVTRGMKQAIIFPQTEGIEDSEEQLKLAKERAKIEEGKTIALQRFTVERHS